MIWRKQNTRSAQGPATRIRQIYKEDKAAVVENFKKLITDGVYAENLYSDLK